MQDDDRGLLMQIPFKKKEIMCRCGCETIILDLEFIKKLTAARWIAGIPFGISSWCRCEKHNREVGGTPTSSHLIGKAADIRTNSVEHRYRILKALMAAGFNRFGIGETFIHVDLDRSKRQNVIWKYPNTKKIW